MAHAPTSAPDASPIQAYLERLHRRFAALDAGRVASYIPELARADPAAFGIVVATVDGQVYEVGDTRRLFTLQSISKPLVYGVALEDQGSERVLQAVGVEPSGDAFNSISLEPGSGRPLNPMINAGAIAVSSLVEGGTVEARLRRVLEALSAYAGRALDIDEAVFESERATGHRNRAIGHMLRNHGIVDGDPEPALELYFRQCSVRVDCRDLALMAATLANGGVHPLTQQRAVRSEFIAPLLSVMTSCGMYDYAGEWIYRIGMPAKSGVGGGIVAVLPGQIGIGVFSPALDERGNSVRGVAVCETLSAELGLHVLLPPRASAASLRSRYSLAGVRSKRRRPPAQVRVLDDEGWRSAVLELQGDLRFATVEPVLREVIGAPPGLLHVVLDFKRVAHADGAAGALLARLVECCAAREQHVVFSRVRKDLLRDFGADLDPRRARSLSFQPQLDGALEWCEAALLARHGAARAVAALPGLAEHRLCAGMDERELGLLELRLRRCRFEAGAAVFCRGDPADALYLLMRGEVSVVVALAQGGVKRLSTLSAGMAFGETALTAGGTRSADVRADTEVECLALPVDAFAWLEGECPRLMNRLLRNLLQVAGDTVARLTAEVAALEG